MVTIYHERVEIVWMLQKLLHHEVRPKRYIFSCLNRRYIYHDFRPVQPFGQGFVKFVGTSEDGTYRNPHDLNLIVVTRSTTAQGQDRDVFDRSDTEKTVCTSSRRKTSRDTGNWVSFDIRGSGRVLKPTHYSIKHGYKLKKYVLYNWVFEASRDDGSEWTVLKKHEEDRSLYDSSDGICSYAIDDDDFGPNPYFGIFRLRMTGCNTGSSERFNDSKSYTLILRQFEVYGKSFG